MTPGDVEATVAAVPEEGEKQVVEAAADAIREYQRAGSAHRGRHACDGAADEILQKALGPDADVWAWARLARKALRLAQGGEPEPAKPRKAADQGRAPSVRDRVGPGPRRAAVARSSADGGFAGRCHKCDS